MVLKNGYQVNKESDLLKAAMIMWGKRIKVNLLRQIKPSKEEHFKMSVAKQHVNEIHNWS